MDISSLATLAGNTLVSAAVTDVWESARQRFSCLFGRGKPDHGMERRLNATHARLSAASPEELKLTLPGEAAQWTTRFGDLLTDHPDAEAELRVLVQEIGAMLPHVSVVSAADHSVSGRDVSISADRGSVAAGVIHGNVTAPGPTRPGPVRG